METRAHHIVIGLFTVLGALAAIVFAIWLSNASTQRDQQYYTVIFNEAVTGLSRGSAVQYSGIRIGDISELRLDADDPRRVIARIRVDADVPIKIDTRARLSFTGITGSSVIELSQGDPESPRLSGQNGEDPVIIASPSPISTLLANGEDLVTNINQLVSSARSIFSEENTARISNTLSAVEQASTSIADQGDNLGELISELTLVTRQAGETLNHTSELMASANQLLNNQGQHTLDGAEEALESIARTSKALEQMVDDNSDALSSGLQGLAQLEPAINELRGSLTSLRSITRRLDDNPSRFLLGRDSMEEFEP
ncbi:MlaD family protein [Halopseudomonas salegens]|uniref:Phospholipid/cholesterol/gamma-HCH transport system substrate-binding protein n=1 Tax=Halopseudomonas salegens TaxID=1434072 RepID=A0A1H2GT14_9GAMM|nr:MlaD family protein [Halopseudomonas salegens]SDU22807.1 phospholipid/cholesterol/gamma-HCH transport system substrate-binding protein [Halopseudomonas salegens]